MECQISLQGMNFPTRVDANWALSQYFVCRQILIPRDIGGMGRMELYTLGVLMSSRSCERCPFLLREMCGVY